MDANPEKRDEDQLIKVVPGANSSLGPKHVVEHFVKEPRLIRLEAVVCSECITQKDGSHHFYVNDGKQDILCIMKHVECEEKVTEMPQEYTEEAELCALLRSIVDDIKKNVLTPPHLKIGKKVDIVGEITRHKDTWAIQVKTMARQRLL